MKKLFALLFVICLFKPIIAQVSYIESRNDIYSFFKTMQLKGVITNYSDYILPLPIEQVKTFLQKIDSAKTKLTDAEREYLELYKIKYITYPSKQVSIFNDFPNNLFPKSGKSFYYYNQDSIQFQFNGLLELRYIYSEANKSNAKLMKYGGNISASYSDWIEANINVVNGSTYGERSAAEYDNDVRRSYTFHDPSAKISNFDYTTGYVRLHKNIFNLEIARQNLLWGNGYLSRTLLGDYARPLDYVKFDFAYKSISYHYIHGWLVSLPRREYYDSNNTDLKVKIPKYIAMSSLRFSDNNIFEIGVTQSVIYANRPFEIAYLNPFLFLESAQRSMNDYDNGFLTFDSKCKVTNGLEVNGTFLFDDLNFNRMFKEWNKAYNRIMWQVGGIITDPLLLPNLKMMIEYTQIRPFTFGHYGIPDALSYTQNGEPLNNDIKPNSIRLSAELEYITPFLLKCNLGFYYQKHGNSVYKEGKRIYNAGGEFSDFYSIYDKDDAFLLGGNVDKTIHAHIGGQWEYLPSYTLNFYYSFKRTNYLGKNFTDNYLALGLKFFFE